MSIKLSLQISQDPQETLKNPLNPQSTLPDPIMDHSAFYLLSFESSKPF
jgi:hypothetical protein